MDNARRTLALLWGVGLVALGAGCGGPSAPDAGDPGVPCTPGTLACSCVADKCGKNAAGEQLLCMGGICDLMACPSGERGCTCLRGSTCNGPGDSCSNGFCLAADCTPGQVNCGCIAGTCDVGATCIDDTVCVDSKGYEGGACLDTGRCHRGNRCDSSTNRCVYCDPGTAGCQCTANDSCNGGLACAAGLCVPSAAMPPVNPVCYTPCLGDAVEFDGGRVQCSTDKLFRGCLPGKTCTSGSCVDPGQTPGTCASDLECPFFQVCLQGGCYSNCEANADCASGMGCYKKACRMTCVVAQGQAACPTGYGCVADDGQNGYCQPVGSASQAATTPLPEGGLHLPVGGLALSNVRPAGDFIVVPRSSITQDVSVRKLWHQTWDKDGITDGRVDAPRDDAGVYLQCNPTANDCPLPWLQLRAAGGAFSQDQVVAFRLAPGCHDDVTNEASTDGGVAAPCPRVMVANAGGRSDAVRWEGALEVRSGSSSTEVLLSYVSRPEGQWTGSMFYLGTFDRTALDGTAGWVQRTNKADVTGVKNGLIQRWGALRGGNLEGWQEFLAVLTSTRTESWKFGTVKDRCRALTGDVNTSCYAYTNVQGVRPYVQDNRDSFIPSGVSELPVAFNLKLDNPATPNRLLGRVESSLAMHYPGNPAVTLEFDGNPADAAACFMGGGTDCMVFLKGQASASAGANRLVSTVGGRYVLGDAPDCIAGFEPVAVPWLVDAFTDSTRPVGAGRVRTECRDSKLPFDTAVDSNFSKVNVNLAGANPVPDGNPRERTLRFLDGALVNQSELFILFEERFKSLVPANPGSATGSTTGRETVAYGFMRLKRSAADLQPSSYVGSPTTTLARTPIAPGARCSQDLLVKMGYPRNSVDLATASAATLQGLVTRLLDGRSGGTDYTQITSPYDVVHYWCEETGMFNGGPGDTVANPATPDNPVQCPVGSKVRFFYAPTKNHATVTNDACNRTTNMTTGKMSCFTTMMQWVSSGVIQELDPVFKCTTGAVYCDDNRKDLRADKTFYLRQGSTAGENMSGLQPLIDSAFRYKTRFRSTSGGTLGFAPRTCVANSDAVPYCYDPKEIEEARARIDCLLEIHGRPDVITGANRLVDPTLAQRVVTFLESDFSRFAANFEGFERLYAELLVMQGDEALTSAYASRFDLAATGGAAFRGSAFEVNGIDLTGVAGVEMYRLYQAAQFYQLALDRLYTLGPNMSQALGRTTQNFVTAATVTEYLERLVRAGSQKSRAWAEVARRYQNFNRPDLARAVIERAYVTTYLESALLSRLMLDIWESSPGTLKNGLAVIIEKTQRSYRMALLDMREVYQQITDEMNFFGYPAEYIPFPTLDSASLGSANAYESLSNLAKQRLDLAKTREQTALSSAKQGRVDAVQFQSDLTSIRNNYENQLASACGVFKGEDGRVYPAIRKYAHQSPRATLMGDPCGRMGNGEIHNAMANVKDTELRLHGVLLRHRNILEDVQTERNRVAQVCGLMSDQVDFQYNRQLEVISVQDEMTKSRALASFVAGSVQAVISSISVLDCEIQCGSSAAMAATVAASGIAAAGAQYATDLRIANKEKELKEFEADTVRFASSFQCAGGPLPGGGTSNTGILQVESEARIASMLNDTKEVEVEALRAEYSLRVAMAEVTRMFSNAQRVQAQQEEAEQLSIDIQEAQNDPNVRIYQNDSVLNADISFRDALATAYRLTRVFEYYTSQSYAKKEQLFLIRMVQAGQYNLENYLLELENEFISFEEQFGNPDVRVLAISLRDDILQIPYMGSNSRPLEEGERIALMRERLRDVKMLDSRGYLTLPFSTTIRALSPVTRNHKVRHVEIDFQGVRLGDHVARAYLRMAGTGVVRNVNDDIDYYVFPERLAVVNASLGGMKVFDGEIYRSYRFRDRPLVNTLWELVLNQRDELVNKDIDLQTLTDIRILIYYSDFTTF